MASNKKGLCRPKPTYTTRSCELCQRLDTDEMVACDKCNKWFHFECVGVTQEIENFEWICRRCQKEDAKLAEAVSKLTVSGLKKSLPPSTAWSVSTMSAKQKRVALLKLEEEQSLRMEMINRKYEILGCSGEDSSDEEAANGKTYSVRSLKNKEVISSVQRKPISESAQPTSSDDERELCNRMNFDDSHRVSLERVRNSYEAKRNSAVQGSMNVFPQHENGTFIIEPDTVGQSQSIQQPQPPTDRKIVRQSEAKQSQYYGRQKSFNGVQFINENRNNEPEMNDRHVYPTVVQSERVQLPSMRQPDIKFEMKNPMDRYLLSRPTFNTANTARQQQQHPRQANQESDFSVDFNQPQISNFQRLEPNQQNISAPNSLISSNNTTTNHKNTSGYEGYNGTLTPGHIAARHVFSKDLPHYWGKPEGWPMFFSALMNSTKECGFSEAKNLGRLQRCLKGDALELVESHLLHASSVPAVVETLHMMFGRPGMIIYNLLEKIQKTPAPKANDLNSLIKFSILVKNLSATIQASGDLEQLNNTYLIQSITDKLPSQIQLNWGSFIIGRDYDLSVMGAWLFNLAEVATKVINPLALKISDKKDRKQQGHQNDSSPSTYVNAHSDDGNSKKYKCQACNTDSKHPLENCKKFKEFSVEDRWSFIKKFRLCGSSFGFHQFYKCLRRKKCGAGGCKREHHVLLHNTNEHSTPKVNIPAGDIATTNAHRTVSSSKFPDIFRIVPVVLTFKGKSVRIFAYLDDGSNLTSLEESVARKLGALGTIEPLCVKWSFGNREVLQDSRQLTVTIRGVNEDAEDYVLNHVRAVKKLMLPAQSITKDWLAQYSHFDNIPISTYESATPQMIIGLEYSKLMVSLDTREGDWSEPLVCKTRIGWVVQGPNNGDENITEKRKYSLNMCECQPDDKSLHQLIADFFSIENLGVRVPDKILEPKEEARAKHILETTIKEKGNHYEVGLLWKSDDINLPNSYFMAKRRLECVQSKMKKDPVLAQRMKAYIQDFIEKGYIRKLTDQERKTKGPRTWYLPIFPVFNPKKPEKLRVVWDGAAKVNGISLNSVLLTGPDLLEPLPEVLRRFREKKIAAIGDLKEMFHQIEVAEPDQDSQRFLWYDDPENLEQEPDEYVLTVDSFGLRCSPTTAQYVKNRNAEKFKDKYPDAAEAIIKGHYVDDMLGNSHTVDEAVKLLTNVQFVHSHAGFQMRNFISNSKELLQLINSTTECGDKQLQKDPKEIERVLGMYWNTTKDTFTYSLKFVKSNYTSEDFSPTKREILRTVMSIFDPLGFLAHFVVHAKIILQEIWRTRLGWDDEIPTSMKEQWVEWLQQLPMVEETHIPRLYSNRMSPQPAKSIQLHMFVDAGIEAYSAVAYFRVEDDDGVDTCIVGAKSRVAPIKPMSVPRLELQGAVLGTRLAVNIIKSHYGLTIDKTTIWCDSRTVLSWLHSDTRKYSQFVTFRVAEILELAGDMEWRWIPSSENVADEATKSKNKANLQSSARWFVGPEFLRKPDTHWQFELEEPEYETKEEMRPVYAMSHLVVPFDDFIDFQRFSNWSRLVRAVAYVLRFIYNSKSKAEHRHSGPFSSEELVLAESLIYRKVQHESFQDELVIIRLNATASVKEQKEFDKSSAIRTCSPYLDENGVMRIMGRIDACSSVSILTKRPVILDKNHYVRGHSNSAHAVFCQF